MKAALVRLSSPRYSRARMAPETTTSPVQPIGIRCSWLSLSTIHTSPAMRGPMMPWGSSGLIIPIAHCIVVLVGPSSPRVSRCSDMQALVEIQSIWRPWVAKREEAKRQDTPRGRVVVGYWDILPWLTYRHWVKIQWRPFRSPFFNDRPSYRFAA